MNVGVFWTSAKLVTFIRSYRSLREICIEEMFVTSLRNVCTEEKLMTYKRACTTEKSMIFERECTKENLTTCKVDDARASQ